MENFDGRAVGGGSGTESTLGGFDPTRPFEVVKSTAL